jgi:hypothetical protein
MSKTTIDGGYDMRSWIGLGMCSLFILVVLTNCSVAADGTDETSVPFPEITSVVVEPQDLYAGDVATIKISVKNTGGPSNIGFIAVSFPDNEDIIEVSGTGSNQNKLFPVGSSLVTSTSSTITAINPLVQLYDDNWDSGQTETLTIKVKVNEGASELRFYVRTTLREKDVANYIRNPSSSSKTDQQGFYVNEYSFDVSEDDSLNADSKFINEDLNEDSNEDSFVPSSEFISEAPSLPFPEITNVVVAPSYGLYAGDVATIKISVKNTGGPSNIGFIAVSFPDNEDIIEVSGTGSNQNKLFPVGSSLVTSTSSTITAINPLVQLYDENWDSGQTETLTIKVEVNEGASELRFYVRTTLREKDVANYIRNPSSSSKTDQQGFYVNEYSFDVINHVVESTITSITPNSATEGTSVSFSGTGTTTNGKIVAYKWTSSYDGQLSTSASFSTSDLSAGTHTIYFSVQDSNGKWSDAASTIVTINANNGGDDGDPVIPPAVPSDNLDLVITVKDSSDSTYLGNTDIYLDGNLIGQTDSSGKLTTQVTEGTSYLLNAEKSGYEPKFETVNAGYDAYRDVMIYLNYAKIPVTIKVEDETGKAVSNALVFLDDKFVDATDVDGLITADANKNTDMMLKVSKDGYYEENALIHIESYPSTEYMELKVEDKTTPNIIIGKVQYIGDDDNILEDGEQVAVSYSVTDDSGVRKIICKLDGKEIDSYSSAGTYSTTTPVLSDGEHVISFTANDNDKNVHSSSKDFQIKVSKRGPEVLFQATKDTINVGDYAVFTLSVLNPIGNLPMDVQLILKAPDGTCVSGSSFAESGAGMYTASYTVEPGDDVKSMSFNIQGNEPGNHSIISEVHYSISGETPQSQGNELILEVTDKLRSSTDPVDPSPGSVLTDPVPGFTGVTSTVGLLLIVLLLRRVNKR